LVQELADHSTLSLFCLSVPQKHPYLLIDLHLPMSVCNATFCTSRLTASYYIVHSLVQSPMFDKCDQLQDCNQLILIICHSITVPDNGSALT